MASTPGGTARMVQGKSSIRTQSKQDPFATKPVFRPVLDNPLNLAWPTLSAPVRKLILDALLEFLSSTAEGELSIADWRLQDHARRRGRVHGAGKEKATDGDANKKRTRDGQMKGKHRAAPGDTVMDDTPVASTSTIPPATHDVSLRSTNSHSNPNSVDQSASAKLRPTPFPRPKLLDHVSIGINEVTRAMESRIRWGRWELGDRKAIEVLSRETASTAKELGNDGEPKKKGTRRGGKKSAISKPTPPSTIDPAAPSYQFLSDIASTDSTPYLLPPTEATPFFRLLANFQRKRANIPAPIRTPLDISSSLVEDSTTGATDKAAQLVDWVPILDIVFVCKPDINPPSLVAHLPTMTAASNGVLQALKSKRAGGDALANESEDSMRLDGRREERDVLLVPLDVGAERQLATVLALRRVAAIGISTEAPGVEALAALVQKHVKPLNAPWLIPHLTQFTTESPATTSQLIPTHVKHLRTTAPVDVKALTAAKLEKKLKRAQGKEVYVAED